MNNQLRYKMDGFKINWHTIVIWWFSTSILISITSCKDNSAKNILSPPAYTAEASQKETGIYIDLEKLIATTKLESASTVSVRFDPFFNSPKKYKGYYINTLIDSIVKANHFDTTNAVIEFECTDGYRPIIDFSKISGDAKGYFAYKDLGMRANKSWADSINSKFKPFYLVWDNVKKQDNSYQWPYGLIGFRLTSDKEKYRLIYPEKDLSFKDGFTLFRDNCIKCHSINKIGGTMGVEFNVPKNITEYWKEADIARFVKNPASFRYNSRMPPITYLQDSQVTKIIGYIKYMKNNKVD